MRHPWIDYDGVVFYPKEQSGVMRAAGWLFKKTGWSPKFMEMWTTIRWPFAAKAVIYFPERVAEGCPWAREFVGVVSHEKRHVRQFERFGAPVYMALAYFVFPLPFRLSGRWWIERGPYLADLEARRYQSVDAAVWALWKYYGKPWPREWMGRWFCKKLGIPYDGQGV